MDNRVSKAMSLFILVVMITASMVMGCQSLTKVDQVATPIITPSSGAYYQPQRVTIVCPTAGAKIHFTLDGSKPTEKSMLYTEPFVAELGSIVKAIAVKPGYKDSKIATTWYDSALPVITGFCPLEQNTSWFAVSGDYAYVIGYDENVTIVNIGDKSNPTVIGTYTLPRQAKGIAISGNTLFVTHEDWDPNHQYDPVEARLVAIDVSNPYSPQMLGSLDLRSRSYALDVQGSYAYLLGEHMKVVDISNPSDMQEVGSWRDGHTWYDTSRIVVQGDFVYATTIALGSVDYLRAFDVSDPSNPFVASAQHVRGAHRVCPVGMYLYVACRSEGLKVFDISNPADMRLVSTCDIASYSITRYGGSLFTSNEYGGLSMISIDNPLQPELICTIAIPEEYGYVEKLSAVHDHLYAAFRESGLMILDIGLYNESGQPSSINR